MNLGIVLHHLGHSQAAFYAINQMNQHLSNADWEHKNTGTLFYENSTHPCMDSEAAKMNLSRISDFRGTIVLTTLDQAETVLKIVNPSRKILYLWDVEWIRNKQYLHNLSILRSENLEIYCRSQYHADALMKYANIDVQGICDNFNLAQLGIGERNEEAE